MTAFMLALTIAFAVCALACAAIGGAFANDSTHGGGEKSRDAFTLAIALAVVFVIAALVVRP